MIFWNLTPPQKKWLIFFIFFQFSYDPNLRQNLTLRICYGNFAICLFIAEVVFLAGIDQVDSKGTCIAVAVLLHFFFTASFIWSAAIAFYFVLVIYGTEMLTSKGQQRKWPFFVGGSYCKSCWTKTTKKSFMFFFITNFHFLQSVLLFLLELLGFLRKHLKMKPMEMTISKYFLFFYVYIWNLMLF